MSSSNTSPDPWLGKLVWIIPRNEVGLPMGNSAMHGIVISKDDEAVYIVLSEGDRWYACVHDMELVENWDEDLEREDSQMEEAREGAREHDRNSPE